MGYESLLEVTPVTKAGDIWVKREPDFKVNGVNGGKARACVALVESYKTLHNKALPSMLITGASRFSPQLAIVAAIAQSYGIPSVGFTAAASESTPAIDRAIKYNMKFVPVKPGYTAQIQSEVNKWAACHAGSLLIPFGMASPSSIAAISDQCVRTMRRYFQDGQALPSRIVMVAGSGVTLCGVAEGLRYLGLSIPILGVTVGHDPSTYIEYNTLYPSISLTPSPVPYKKSVTASLGGFPLDSRYEAKAVSFLKPGDLFWIIGYSD